MNVYKMHDSLMNSIECTLEDYCKLYGGDVDQSIQDQHGVVSQELYKLISMIDELENK